MKALGIHVFAGGFTHGVKKVFDVQCQLETHNFGRETCEQTFNTEFINHADAKWPEYDVDFIYGNPRCTAFSCMTAGYDDNTHGAFASQTIDIHQLCEYAVNHADIVVWESVQQAFSTGRPLLNHLRDNVFLPAGFRIAHILLTAHSFGNAQNRRRYFFVAYKRGRNFNIVPPELPSVYQPTLYDAIWDLRDRETHFTRTDRTADYDFDTSQEFTPDEHAVLPRLPNGWSLNTLGEHRYDDLPDSMKACWDRRISNMPFSMHCCHRTQWMRPAPTLHGSCARFIHPWKHRGWTVGETATVMGWEGLIPRGINPYAQLAKGVCPCAGEWLAEQAKLYLEDHWKDEDWESSYNHNTGRWEGQDCHGADEKVFKLTSYFGHHFDEERFHEDARTLRHR